MIKTFEETDFCKDTWEPYVDEVSVTYYQPKDSTEIDVEDQSITLTTRNNGMGRFVNIKTDNWSIDGIKDLEKLINDFRVRAGIKDEVTDNGNGEDRE